MKPEQPFLAQKLENSRLLREDIARRSVRFRALPEVVTLNHSDLCNLRCVMCPRNLAQGTHRLSRRVLSYIADELFPTARKLVLTTSGGDPLAADYDFLLDRALTYGVHMDAVTNGVLLTPEVYRRSRGALDHLNVSLDSHVPEVYERIRLGARFDQVIGNLRAIQAERASHPDDVLYSTSAVVMRSNLPHLAEFVRFAASLGFEAVVFQRLLHSVKPTPEEDPETHCGADAMRESFTRAENAAREVGVNLYLTEFGLPSVLARPLRSKRPDPLLGQRLCWFMAQNFGVMYTGEVYPCCVPTDHSLGNVLYDDPVSIWNGRAAQDLRAAQMSGRGTVFCSGCLHAPHLPARKVAAVQEAVRVVRRAWHHGVGSLRQRWRARRSATLIDPPRPPTVTCDGGFARRPAGRDVVTPVPHLRNDVAAVAADGSLLLIRDGELVRAGAYDEAPRVLARLHPEPAPRATLLKFVAPGALMAAFAGGGRVLRIRLDAPEPRVEVALELSDPRAFVRQPAAAIAPDRSIVIGEYGVHPGARCGRLYRASSAIAPFTEIVWLDWARHIHAVHAARDGSILFTTGDLAERRRFLHLAPGSSRPRTIESAWSGFTSIAETDEAYHFGTDLRSSNALLRRSLSLREPAQARALPDAIDLQVRDIVAVGGGRLVALLGMDADLVDRRDGRRASVLVSDDAGSSWSIAHEFAADWNDAPEALLALPGSTARVLTQCSDAPVLITLG